MCPGHPSPVCVIFEHIFLSGFHALCSSQPHLLHAKPTVSVRWDTLMAKAWPPGALSLAGWGDRQMNLALTQSHLPVLSRGSVYPALIAHG